MLACGDSLTVMDSCAAHPPGDAGELERVIAALDHLLPAEPTQWPGGYPGQVELALIDAIVSIRTRYGQPHNGVRGQVALWRTHRGEPADNLRVLAASDPTQILSNKQHLTGGLTKPQAIQAAATALVNSGVITAADVLARPDQARAAYTGVTGLSTVTFDYFLMLLGTETVKPDTWVLRYLHQVLDRPVSTGEASALLTNAAHRMGRSPREVDHQVWLHMRQTTAASPGGIGVSTRQPAPAALELGSATVERSSGSP